MMAKLGSVQRAFIPVRALGDRSLILASPHAPTAQDLIGVLEVSGLNYPLKSQAEQRQINDLFQVVLASLTYPLQILMRVMPFDLEGYLATFGLGNSEQEQAKPWQDLITSYAAFLRARARTQMLMQRRFYVIVPAGQTVHEEETTTLLHQVLRLTRSKESETKLAQAHQQLELRCAELTRQFSVLGLTVRRLDQRECLDLEYGCLSVQRARNFPLQDAWIEDVKWSSVRHAEGHTDHPLAISQIEEQDHLSTRDDEHKCLPLFHKDQQGVPHRRHWLADLLAPAGIQLMADALVMEEEWVQVNEVVTLPRMVTAGWFNRLASIAVPMDLCIYYAPLPISRTMRELQRARFVVSTSNVFDNEHGRRDPVTRIAQDDIEGLMDRMASGED